MTARLTLKDGSEYRGSLPGWFKGEVSGEVVFNTGMTGYVESLTDPSYAGQILTFTYPLIGNYGVHARGWESEKIHAKAVIVAERVDEWSHPKSSLSFVDWLKAQNVPVLSGVDTRHLTRHLRDRGSMPGYIGSGAPKFTDEKPRLGFKRPRDYNPAGKKKVIVLDCGAKESIIRSLVGLDMHVRRVPGDYDFANEKYDGVVLSNGPGNPADYRSSINIIKKVIQGTKPVFGICLGSQLMALAAGASTYKLKFGHRGHNQPCMDNTDKSCYITSQNHGYAIDRKSLPPGWSIYFSNLNDDSAEGIMHRSKPFFSVQFHPEANPGPTDTAWLFDKFARSL